MATVDASVEIKESRLSMKLVSAGPNGRRKFDATGSGDERGRKLLIFRQISA